MGGGLYTSECRNGIVQHSYTQSLSLAVVVSSQAIISVVELTSTSIRANYSGDRETRPRSSRCANRSITERDRKTEKTAAPTVERLYSASLEINALCSGRCISISTHRRTHRDNNAFRSRNVSRIIDCHDPLHQDDKLPRS